MCQLIRYDRHIALCVMMNLLLLEEWGTAATIWCSYSYVVSYSWSNTVNRDWNRDFFRLQLISKEYQRELKE